MKVSEIYEKYKIMPNLQLHMAKVAAVASLIVSSFDSELDKDSIISACLLHDMGNIIKFDLTKFPESVEPQGLDYWESVKKSYIEKYGNKEHEATYEICKELDVTQRVSKLVNGFGFSKGKSTLEIDDLQIKVCAYSDHRVSPYGIWPLDEKLKDMDKRYQEAITKKYTVDDFENLFDIWLNIEKQIFTHCKIKPSDVTNEVVDPVIESLREFKIVANESKW